MMTKNEPLMTKNAAELNIGDEWIENRRRVRMTGSRPYPVRTIIWIDVEDTETGERRSIAFYRVNRRALLSVAA